MASTRPPWGPSWQIPPSRCAGGGCAATPALAGGQRPGCAAGLAQFLRFVSRWLCYAALRGLGVTAAPAHTCCRPPPADPTPRASPAGAAGLGAAAAGGGRLHCHPAASQPLGGAAGELPGSVPPHGSWPRCLRRRATCGGHGTAWGCAPHPMAGDNLGWQPLAARPPPTYSPVLHPTAPRSCGGSCWHLRSS